MALSKIEVRQLVLESLVQMVELHDTNDIPTIEDWMHPVNDLGLDSPDGVDFAGVLSEKLKFHIPNEINPFKDDETNRTRRVGQIVDFIFGLIEEANHV